jgi:signal transduction histidine kinase
MNTESFRNLVVMDAVDTVDGLECGAVEFISQSNIPEEALTCVNTQITMQKLHKELYTKNQELSEKHTAVSRQLEDLRLNLSFALPHELRTPLNVILGFSQLLLLRGPEQLPQPEKILSIQGSIYKSALRLERLIENYLLYAQLQLMKYDSERKQGKIWQGKNIIYTKHVISFWALSKAEEVRRQEDLRMDLIEAKIRISEKSLQKIIEELLDNAFKFSKPGTPVHVVTELNRQQWMLKITDQGRGMTGEQIENIGAYMQFERKRYEQQGSGLGLIIARLLTQLNDGELRIESDPNQGTTVTVVFNVK